MPQFFYQAFSKDGKKATGYIDAPSSAHVKEQLVRQGLFPTTITIAKEGSKLSFWQTLFAGKVTNKDKILFTRQLYVLLKAGVPLLQAIELLVDQFTGKLKTMLITIKDDLKEGTALAAAIAKYPDVFDKIYVQLVRAGEASGKMESVLERLIVFYERKEDLRKRISGALTYPIIQLVVAVLVVVFLMVFVVPNIVKSAVAGGKELPLPTKIVISLSNIFQHYYLAIFIILGALYAVFKYIKSTDAGARVIDTLKLKLPMIKYFTRINAVVQFSQTLGLLISSGVNLSESLDIVVSIVDNKILADTLNEARDKIIKQGKIAQYLKQTNLFPPIAIYMIGTGEESGQLDVMLLTVSRNYEEELGEIADKITASLGPVMTIFMAIAVGFIITAVALPIIQQTQGMAK